MYTYQEKKNLHRMMYNTAINGFGETLETVETVVAPLGQSNHLNRNLESEFKVRLSRKEWEFNNYGWNRK